MKIKTLSIAVVASCTYIALGLNNLHSSLIGTGALCITILPFNGLSSKTDVDDLKPLNKTILKVKAGVDAGKAILGAIATKEYSTVFGKVGDIAKHLAPFLGAIGPLFGFLDFFFPKGPSPELQYMVKEFAEVNKKLDEVFADIDDVQKLIIKESLKEQYGKYQGVVHALSDLLAKVLDAKATNLSSDIVEERKKRFLQEFDRDALYTALDSLFMGMTEKAYLFIHIPESIRTYTDEDRVKLQNAMKIILNVILKGVKVLLAFDQMKGKVQAYKDDQKEWTAKIREITSRMLAVDKDVKDKYRKQLKIDVDKILTEKKDLSNKQLADYLYSFLTSKYDWLDWYVVVYNEVHGDAMHYVDTKSGFAWYGVQGRNVILNNFERAEYKIKSPNYSKVKLIIDKIRIGKYVTKPFFWGHVTSQKLYNAHELFNYLKFQNPCEDSVYKDMGSGVISKTADPQYRAPEGKYLLVDKTQKLSDHKFMYRFHVFGLCVVPPPPKPRQHQPDPPDDDN